MISRRKIFLLIIIIIIAVTGFVLLHMALAATAAEPGTDENPLVAKDYVDEKISELAARIDAIMKMLQPAASPAAVSPLVSPMNSPVNTPQSVPATVSPYPASPTAPGPAATGAVSGTTPPPGQGRNMIRTQGFEVVNVKAWRTLIAGAGTEIIVRSGKVKALGGPGGGLSDVTTGTDLKTGQVVPPNHLIIIPRDDGRGLKTASEAWIMVKGTYTIE